MPPEAGDKEERGFVVIDRRGRGDESRAEPAAPAPGAPTAQSRAATPPADAGATAGSLPRIDFSTLVLSLSTSVLYHLGLVEDPETRKPGTVNKALARQNIDMLEVLQEKTRGNLSPDEEHLLESLLYDLRMRFVELR